MTTTNEYIAAAMEAMLNNDTDRALGLLLRASLSYDDDIDRQIVSDAEAVRQISVPNDADRVYADELPKMVRANRKASPADFKCPLCSAKPGKPCVKISNRGGNRADGPAGVGEALSGGNYHDDRRELSKEANRK